MKACWVLVRSSFTGQSLRSYGGYISDRWSVRQKINGLRERQMNKAITKNYSTLGVMTA